MTGPRYILRRTRKGRLFLRLAGDAKSAEVELYGVEVAGDTECGDRDRPVVFVKVSGQMEAAGLAELREDHFNDPAYLVRSIYMAMEYERLRVLGELGSITDDALHVLQREVANRGG